MSDIRIAFDEGFALSRPPHAVRRRLLAAAMLLLVGYVSIHAAYVYRIRRDTPFLRGEPTYGGWCPPADWDTCSLDRVLHHAWSMVGR